MGSSCRANLRYEKEKTGKINYAIILESDKDEKSTNTSEKSLNFVTSKKRVIQESKCESKTLLLNFNKGVGTMYVQFGIGLVSNLQRHQTYQLKKFDKSQHFSMFLTRTINFLRPA